MTTAKSKLLIISTHSTNVDAKLSDHFVKSGENTGNFIYLEALKGIFPSATVASIAEIQSRVEEFRDFDVAIWACANQLGSHTKSIDWSTLVRNLDIPNILVGLGAQAPSEKRLAQIPDGTLDWVKAVVARNRAASTSNISTRGPVSTSLLNMYGIDSFSITCPSITLIPRERVGISGLTRDQKRIAVAAGHTDKQTPEDIEVERVLFKLAVETNGAYILQADEVLYSALTGTNPKAMAIAHSYLSPATSLADFTKDYLKVTKSFVDIRKWEQELLDCQFMVGTRIHGVMLGRIAGLPSLLVTSDSRTKELALTTGTPNISIKDFAAEIRKLGTIDINTMRTLVERFQINSANQVRLYDQRISEFKKFFESQGLIYDMNL